MFGNRDIPVYLFTGFLESGKSTCFQEILEEGNFEDGLRTLYLMTEEGEKETVQIKFPLNLAKVVLKMGIVQKQLNAKFGEKVNLDIEEILALIDSEVIGNLMTIDTKDAKIRIWID